MAEQWKDIAGYDGVYQISDMGNIRAVPRIVVQNHKDGRKVPRRFKGSPIKPTDNGNGYLIVQLRKDNARHNHYVHRLVASHFISDIPQGYVINHKDFNKSNNNVENLEIVTQKENVLHAVPRMSHPKKKPMGKSGERYIACRLTGFEVVVNKVYLGRFKTLEKAIEARDKQIEKVNYY